MRLLLVEDDKLLAQGIVTALSKVGYQLEHCQTGNQALQAINHSEFDLIILDLGLPDGFAKTVLDKLRSQKHTLPVLVLTALDQLETKLSLLNAGADDYMIKPFDVRELEARIRVLMRRQSTRRHDVLTVGKVSLDLANHSCDFAGQAVNLTRREFLLLQDFLQHKDQILTRQHLEELSVGWDGDNESNAIEVHIHNLRKKLQPELIKTVRGVGYLLPSNLSE
ncbi:response regulator transcription factor [Alishewanella sp. 16-MA]|uniref:Response regulator transcription factor n=1 Tax=Alishewanella maricola TaxID=2795740 RepID=A0ABS8C2Y2_9ALTE|nr:response regulator transcription factor [Alishewanella maricola]MCB5226694.1 response regulator transcription factor [Alishewanella maricola]